jgi:hypothetical protein
MAQGDPAAADLLASSLAQAGLPAASVRPLAASLEDVFIARLHQLHGTPS